MGLSDLTDRGAVIKALEEYDTLGRDDFLRKYGFGPAVEFWLVYRGRAYDSKAIVGAAHGFQHPDLGPLKAGKFSGGESTVERKLDMLGFTVLRGTSAEAVASMSLDLFRPTTDACILTKDVGSSQHTDGVRIDQAFHSVFNPPDSPSYTPRGRARDILVLFNNMVFPASYRYEGQTDAARHLESIRFKRDLLREFKLVFPDDKGAFTIRLGQDVNHFVFTHSVAAEADTEDYGDGYPEGRVAYSLHRRLERKPEVVKKAKQRFLEQHNGVLFCEACGIDFFVTYGPRGLGFIEAHHKKPVNEMSDGDKTKVGDLAMLCSNCHRMIHRKPTITLDKLVAEVSACRATLTSAS